MRGDRGGKYMRLELDRVLGTVFGFFGGGLAAMVVLWLYEPLGHDGPDFRRAVGQASLAFGVLGYFIGRAFEPR